MSTDPASRQLDSPQLRLFQPDDAPSGSPPPLSPGLTVRQFFDGYVAPVCVAGKAARTLDQYLESIALWEQLTPNPPLLRIDELTGAQYQRGLAARRGTDGPLASNTVRKHVTAIQFILDRAGPKTRKLRDAKGLLREVPYLPRPPLEVREVIDNFTLPEIAAIVSACLPGKVIRSKKLPVAPHAYWRAVFLFDYNAGPRIGSLTRLRFDRFYQDDLGWWVRAPTKKHRTQDVYLNAHAMAAIDSIRTARELVFPWPYSHAHWHRARNRIFAAAGIPDARWFGTHGFRKAFATELAKIDGLAVSMALGHSAGPRHKVAIDHYVNRCAMVAAINQLPQPACQPPPDPQLRLF